MDGFQVYDSKLSDIDFSISKIINTINPHSYCIAKNDPIFEKALKSSDILLPDGVGIVLAERFLNKKKIKKIAGYDLFLYLMEKLNDENGTVFFLGSAEETLTKIKTKCKLEYPNLSVGYYSPPFKQEFSIEDSRIMYNEVNKFKPDVLFVGMTAPKQERWVYKFKNYLEVKNICAIGAVFDFYVGNVNRAPQLVIRLGLEWLHRSLKSKRLFKRNFISNPKFILYMLKLKYLKITK